MFKKNFFVNWFHTKGRDFPWREEGISPFALLITEMLLRQTRASNVAKIWPEFIRKYPSAHSLVQASKEDLVSQLRVLGFGRQKAEALKLAAAWLIDNHNGEVPATLCELLNVPHVGDYTARAVLCFGFGQKVETVDTNVLRLFSRYFGINLKADIRRTPGAWQIARQILPRETRKIQEHTYGLLDFTADICKSGRPRCEACPLSSSCVWAKNLVGHHETKPISRAK